MTFEAIWQQLASKNPAIDKPDTVVEFKAGNLKTLLRQVYEQGRKSAPADGRNPLDDIFGTSIFGGK